MKKVQVLIVEYNIGMFVTENIIVSLYYIYSSALNFHDMVPAHVES